MSLGGVAACAPMPSAPPAAAQAATPTPAPAATPVLNAEISSTMTCSEVVSLSHAGTAESHATLGVAIIWLDGVYSARNNIRTLPAGWTQTVAQGVGGTCGISVNAHRPVLDVIGEIHRTYGGKIGF